MRSAAMSAGVGPSIQTSPCLLRKGERITFTSCLPSQVFLPECKAVCTNSDLLALPHLPVLHNKVL